MNIDEVHTVARRMMDIPVPSYAELWAEQFKNVSIVSDWRYYIYDSERKQWHKYTDLERLFLYINAKVRADAEEWD